MTLEELRCLAQNDKWQSFITEVFRHLLNITGSSAYWHKVQQDLKNITMQGSINSNTRMPVHKNYTSFSVRNILEVQLLEM